MIDLKVHMRPLLCCIILKYFSGHYLLTRTKTSIRYSKENDREKRERKVEGDIYREREGEIKERERERLKGYRERE